MVAFANGLRFAGNRSYISSDSLWYVYPYQLIAFLSDLHDADAIDCSSDGGISTDYDYEKLYDDAAITEEDIDGRRSVSNSDVMLNVDDSTVEDFGR